MSRRLSGIGAENARLNLGSPLQPYISGHVNVLRRCSVQSTNARTFPQKLALEAAYPDANRDRRFNVVPLGEGPGVRTAARPLLRVLGVAVALVLLIACANVAGLLVVRALGRQKEIAASASRRASS